MFLAQQFPVRPVLVKQTGNMTRKHIYNCKNMSCTRHKTRQHSIRTLVIYEYSITQKELKGKEIKNRDTD